MVDKRMTEEEIPAAENALRGEIVSLEDMPGRSTNQENRALEAECHDSLASCFEHLKDLIESLDGCSAKVYRLGRQFRAAHFAPGELREDAKDVFLHILCSKEVLRVKRRWATAGMTKDQREIRIRHDFADWDGLSKVLKQWSLDPKSSNKRSR